MTTIDTTAGNKISLKSDNLNVLTDGKATLTAKEYEFSANGYIGGLTSTDNMSVDEKVVNIMENYIHIPDTVGTPGNINIAGGTITAINTPTNAHILSKGDVKLTGANAGTINTNAGNIKGAVTNNNTVNLSGGTLSKAISGSGTTNITGIVSSNSAISQAISIASAGDLTISASNVGGNVTNAGDLILNGGTLSKSVTGSGKTSITGAVTANSAISQAISIAASGDLTANA